MVKDGLFVTELLIYASEHILAVSGGMPAMGAVLLGFLFAFGTAVWKARVLGGLSKQGKQ